MSTQPTAIHEHARLALGDRQLHLHSLGRARGDVLRLQVDSASIELPRQDWTYVYKLLGGLLAPLPEPPGPRKVRTGPARRGAPWKDDEDNRLSKAWLGGATLADLADEHERTQGALAARLVRIGVVDDRDQARRQSRTGERSPPTPAKPAPG